MKLTYETGIATLIQFIVLSILNIIDAVYSIIDTCTHTGGNCVPNMLTSIVFYILVVAWFGFIVGLGYNAQAKRSKRLCKLLIAAEFIVFIVAGYNIKLGITYHNGPLTLFTSLIDLIMSVWIISLARRLMKAGNTRVVRRRVHSNVDNSDDPDD
jgi:uncharacterized RDD family membrane protein YckC